MDPANLSFFVRRRYALASLIEKGEAQMAHVLVVETGGSSISLSAGDPDFPLFWFWVRAQGRRVCLTLIQVDSCRGLKF